MSGDGMSDFITALTGTNGITADNLWSSVTDAAPLVITVVLFSFGYYIIKKVVKGSAKGKVRL